MTLFRAVGSLAVVLVSLSLACLACGEAEEVASEEVAASSDAITGAFAAGSTLATTARLNLRRTPSTTGEIIVTLAKGARVELLESGATSGFFHVEHDGQDGWAHSAYLARSSGGSEASETSPEQPSTSDHGSGAGGDFDGRVFSNVSIRWQGDYDYLVKCDPPWGAQFSCNAKASRDFVDNALWIAVPHASFSKALCNTKARVCKNNKCVIATVIERGATSYFEGSTGVLAAMGVKAGANGCASFGTATGVTVTLQ